MDEFDTHINIDEVTKIKDSDYYQIKNIEIEHPNLKLTTPYKILEGKNVNKDDIPRHADIPLLFEQYAYIASRSWSTLYYLLEEADREKVPGLNKMVGIRSNLWKEYPNTISFVFSKYPFRDDLGIEPLNYENIYSLLDYLHSSSRIMVLCPDIVLKSGKESLDIDSYLDFVYNCMKYLSDKNNKPVFVPIQPRLSRKRLKYILTYYKNKNIRNLWVNLCATQIGGTYFTYIRTLLQVLDDIYGLNNVTLYYSHIKKEIDPNIFEERASGSDILSQFFCADFVGINREPYHAGGGINPEDSLEQIAIKKGFSNASEYKEVNNLHKHRLFDPDSYYYYTLDTYPTKIDDGYRKKLLSKESIYKLHNSLLLSQEIENTKKYTLEHRRLLKEYVNKKEALNRSKEILDNIISSTSHVQTLLDFDIY